MDNNYKQIRSKLERYLRKYYTNKIIKGVIYTLSIVILIVLLTTFSEYYVYFSSGIRTGIFYGLITLFFVIVVVYIGIPLLRLMNFFRDLSYEESSKIIGRHFPEIRDKLLNTLQLINTKEYSDEELALVEASIEQKIKKLRPVPFQNAVSFRDNRKHLKYLVSAVLILVIIIILTPEVLTEPSTRILNYNKHYKRELPFSVKLMNRDLTAIQNEDFGIYVTMSGDEIPDKLFVNVNGTNYLCSEDNEGVYVYVVRNIQKNTDFNIIAGEYQSTTYVITVHPRPIILEYEIFLYYPTHTKQENKVVKNNGDLIIPEGTRVLWKVYSRDVDYINFILGDEAFLLPNEGSNVYKLEKKIIQNKPYKIITGNQWVKKSDSLSFNINVIPDQYPEINVNRIIDSSEMERGFFTGAANDDYGLSVLNFNYAILSEGQIEKEILTEEILIEAGKSDMQFFYQVNPESFNLKEGEYIEAYFEIFDNDGINGHKSSKSELFVLKGISKEEILNELEEEESQITGNIQDNINAIKEINDEIEDLIEKLMNKDEIDWRDREMINELLEKQKKVYDEVKKVNDKNKKRNFKENKNREQEERILEKQRELEKLFNEALDEETRKMIEELQKLLEEFNKDRVNDMLEQIQMNNEELERSLDRNLELFKQLEFEKKLTEAIEKLEELEKKQEELMNKSEEKEDDKESLAKEQENIGDEFEKIEEDLDDLKGKNEELEEKHDIPELDESRKEVGEEMTESKNDLNRGKIRKSMEHQQKAKDGLKNMKEQLFQFMKNMQSQQLGEDIAKLREILENIIKISFDQEEIMGEITIVDTKDPNYVELIIEQNNLKEEIEHVKDSIYALSKRQITIEPVVNKEIKEIDRNLKRAIDEINDRKIEKAASRQQFVITALNNLGLLLAEALKTMENNMAMQNAMSGKSNCSNPGGGKSKSKSLSQLQQQLNKQIEQMKNNKGKKKDGKGKDGKAISEQLARMAAEQEMIRNQLQRYIEELAGEGINENGLQDALKQMEETEKEIIKSMINNETLERQKEILTRLLKSEKAEIEREKKKERESKEAIIYEKSNPNEKFEYKEYELKETELLKRINPKLKEYYRQKVSEYFKKFYFENE